LEKNAFGIKVKKPELITLAFSLVNRLFLTIPLIARGSVCHNG
jgi:hypothetical protein